MRNGKGEIAARPLMRLQHAPGLGALHALVGQHGDPIEKEERENKRRMRPDDEGQRGLKLKPTIRVTAASATKLASRKAVENANWAKRSIRYLLLRPVPLFVSSQSATGGRFPSYSTK